MGGLVAGCAITDFNLKSERLRLVALTVNNNCNLKCPHCYLQYTQADHLISKANVDALIEQDFEHLAIVGKEPFLNQETSEHTCWIAEKAVSYGKSVSVVTNGLGLNHLSQNQVNLFEYFDISFDGGPATYQKFRGASYDRLERNLIVAVDFGAHLNAIQVLYHENITNIDDMISITSRIPLKKMMFSPYMVSENDGHTSVAHQSLKHTLNILAKKHSFLESDESFFLIDQYHLDTEGLDKSEIQEEVSRLNLERKIHFVPFTPLQIGSIRATYDGLLLLPSDALHPSEYARVGLPLASTPLNDAYEYFLEKEIAGYKPSDNLLVAVG